MYKLLEDNIKLECNWIEDLMRINASDLDDAISD